jgi:hypothetical protein
MIKSTLFRQGSHVSSEELVSMWRTGIKAPRINRSSESISSQPQVVSRAADAADLYVMSSRLKLYKAKLYLFHAIQWRYGGHDI